MNAYLLAGTLGAMILSFIIGGVFGYEYRAAKVPQELTAQQAVDVKACQANQQPTQKADNDLQKNRDLIAGKLAAVSVRQPAACVSVAVPTHVRTSGTEHAGSDGKGSTAGLSSNWLRTYAAEAETYRSELSVCTDFIAAERK